MGDIFSSQAMMDSMDSELDFVLLMVDKALERTSLSLHTRQALTKELKKVVVPSCALRNLL